MALVLNNITIESRESDSFVNATQLCKAGGKEFKHWYSLDSTKELIKELSETLKVGIPTFKNLVETKKGRYNSGSWIHPDLAVQLAQWISPSFAIQVSRWIRELFITGSVSIDSKKTDDELKELQKQVQESKEQIIKLESKQLKLESFVKNIKMLEKNQRFYISTTRNYASQNRFEYGGVKDSKDLTARLATYNTGRAEGDLVYYTKLFKCNNYKLIEERINSVLCQFKDKLGSRKEMIHMRYNLLVEVVDFICENYDREVEYINSRCQQFLHDTIEGESVIPEPIDLSSCVEVSVRRNGIAKIKKIDVSGWEESKIDALIEEIINRCATEHKSMEYNFNTQKNSVALELTWSLITPYLDIYNGLTKTNWRAEFKRLLNTEKPRKLKIKGIKLD